LRAAPFTFADYTPPTAEGDHHHRVGCWATYAIFDEQEILPSGYFTTVQFGDKSTRESRIIQQARESGRECPAKTGTQEWICSVCFQEFSTALAWKLKIEITVFIIQVAPFLARVAASRYSLLMMDEQEFKRRCDAAFESLLRRLQEVGDERGFEVEGGSGKLEVLFEDAEETRFVISPNTPVRQIWISALTTSFKLSWSDAAATFVLDKTGETLMQLMGRILTEQLGSPVTV
jgi:iron donor protein CyaY